MNKIFCMCVDPERGAYLAFFSQDPSLKVVCGGGVDEAVGRLVRENPTQSFDSVEQIDTSWK